MYSVERERIRIHRSKRKSSRSSSSRAGETVRETTGAGYPWHYTTTNSHEIRERQQHRRRSFGKDLEEKKEKVVGGVF